MKKGGLVTLFLAVALVFCAGQFVSAATIDVVFSGPYDAKDLPSIGVSADPEPNGLVICQTELLTYGSEVPDPLGVYDPTLPAGTRAFVFKNAEVNGYPGFEVWSHVHTLNPSYLEPDLVNNTDLWTYKWWTHVSTTPPAGHAAEGGSYIHFYGGSKLQGLKFFDITFMTDDLTWDPADISVHPTPIPSALLLLGSGFVGLVGLRRFRKK